MASTTSISARFIPPACSRSRTRYVLVWMPVVNLVRKAKRVQQVKRYVYLPFFLLFFFTTDFVRQSTTSLSTNGFVFFLHLFRLFLFYSIQTPSRHAHTQDTCVLCLVSGSESPFIPLSTMFLAQSLRIYIYCITSGKKSPKKPTEAAIFIEDSYFSAV